ncbi:protein RIC-3 [Ambystoma mexicanum]|uniref:protein RIC-3 n=1 Tax=Ambystoma mexicanum TaxID=8296 RepID=UPI0037E7A778
MALSTFQKVALVSGLVLCVSLLLPKTFLSRGKQSGQLDGSPGRFPPTMHPKPSDSRSTGSHFPRSHLTEAVSKTKSSTGVGGATRQNLLGQIIPVYGFGILLYILYILFKLSSKGKGTQEEKKCAPVANGNLKRKITDYELGQLQDKLKETEEAMEKIISNVGPNCERAENVTLDQEQRLLQQLKEITRVMKEGKLIDGMSPEKEAEEAPYMEDWEGYPEETFPILDTSQYCKRNQDTIFVDTSVLNQPSPEEIAERMEVLEDEEHLYPKSFAEVSEINSRSTETQKKGQHVSFIDQCGGHHGSGNVEKCRCCDQEEEDPAVIAENAGFSSDSCSEQDVEINGQLFSDSEDESEISNDTTHVTDPIDTLRKRSAIA